VSHGGTGAVNKSIAGLSYLRSLSPWKGTGSFTLEAITAVMRRLGNPQDDIPTIHIAGTNGKGSVSAATASILGAAGYRVGLNSSPHLQQLNERIVIDGKSVEDEYIGEFAHEVREAARRAGEDLSFHEALTAISFLGFRESGLEWVVMEVGLGGLLDASNVIRRPAAAAIVTIDFDHQHVLGNTLSEIAFQKAGIIKAGAPVIVGSVGSDARRVIKKAAAELNAPILTYSEDFGVHSESAQQAPATQFWCKSTLLTPETLLTLSSHLPGAHQSHNMAIAAMIGLTVGIPATACRSGVENVSWPGRLERVKVQGTDFLLDCAHNPAGVRSFISFLDSQQLSGIDLTFGALDTKNWKEMVELLAPYVSNWRILRPESERALDGEFVREFLALSGPEVNLVVYEGKYESWLKEVFQSSTEQTYFVTGSMYMVGRVRSMLGVEMPRLWKRAEDRSSRNVG
jgi:dihydrofolate synthase/folylpolyglutamate synthase